MSTSTTPNLGLALRASVALNELAKASPYRAQGHFLEGDGIAANSIFCGDSGEAQWTAQLANSIFRHAVARAIEAIDKAMNDGKEAPQ